MRWRAIKLIDALRGKPAAQSLGANQFARSQRPGVQARRALKSARMPACSINKTDNDAEPAHVPRNKDGAIRAEFVEQVARGDRGGRRRRAAQAGRRPARSRPRRLAGGARAGAAPAPGRTARHRLRLHRADRGRRRGARGNPRRAAAETVAEGVRDLESDDAVAILEDLPQGRAGRDPRAIAAARARRARPQPANTRKIPPAGACRPNSSPCRRLGPSGRRSTTCARPPICPSASTNFTWSTSDGRFSARCRSTGCCAASGRCRSSELMEADRRARPRRPRTRRRWRGMFQRYNLGRGAGGRCATTGWSASSPSTTSST